METLKKFRYPPLCLVCGVDSGPIKTFLFVFIGGLFLSSILFMLWALGTRRLGVSERYANLANEAENKKERL